MSSSTADSRTPSQPDGTSAPLREDPERTVFVAGTDTGIGKTSVSAALVRALGSTARYFKPVQTGDDDDTASVAQLAELPADRVEPAGVSLPLPASPHQAAAAAGTSIALQDLRAELGRRQQAAGDGGAFVVEFAGGLMVPYGDGHLQIDWLAEAPGARVVLAARSGLGTLNHTLLSVEALRSRGIALDLLVLVGDAHPSNERTLAEATGVPLVRMPWFPNLDAQALGDWVDHCEWPRSLRVGPTGDSMPISHDAQPRDRIARDRKVIWHPYTQHGIDDEPLDVVGARGSWLELADGSRLIDGISSWWTSLHGHGRPEILDAVRRQGAHLDHVLFAGATHEPAVALAEKLVACTPPGLDRVFYSDDGSTAVEVALKVARQAWVLRGEPQRSRFLVLEGGYHGDTVGAMSAGDPDPFFGAFGPMLFDVQRVPVDAEAVRGALLELGDRAAGVLFEPLVQGAAGMRMHGADFVRSVREACTEAGVPMIADEVMTGFGRTGSLFACERAGVAPDMMCLSKGLTGGILPLAVTLTTEDLFQAFWSDDKSRMLFHGHSFTANPLGCAAALASLELVEREGTVERLDGIGAVVESRLRDGIGAAEAERLGLRRCGNIVALDLPSREGGYMDDISRRVRHAAREGGCLLRPLGPVLYSMPPASTSDSAARQLGETMLSLALDALAKR